MAFTPVRFMKGKTTKAAIAASQTIVKGDALVDNGSGYLQTASAGGGDDVEFVALQGSASAAVGTEILVIRARGTEFEADTDAAVAQTDVGTYADLASKSTIDPDASADDIFYIKEIVGAAGTATKVRGWFANGVPNS